ncbi:MAG: hypothetical protein JNL70_01365 [Saprospiraceae bacterium]|nr:hypothetical protein [Saprospiraceae bacterium]
MTWYESDCADYAAKAVANLTQGKSFTETTLLKDLNVNLDAIKNAFLKVRAMNNPNNINRLNDGSKTIAELRKQYYNLRMYDMDDTD